MQLEPLNKFISLLESMEMTEKELSKRKGKYINRVGGIARNMEASFEPIIEDSKVLGQEEEHFFKQIIFRKELEYSDLEWGLCMAVPGCLFIGYWILENDVAWLVLAAIVMLISIGLIIRHYYRLPRKVEQLKIISHKLYMEAQERRLLLEENS